MRYIHSLGFLLCGFFVYSGIMLTSIILPCASMKRIKFFISSLVKCLIKSSAHF